MKASHLAKKFTNIKGNCSIKDVITFFEEVKIKINF